MFRLDPNPTFTARVALSVPGAEQPVNVTFTFKHKGVRALADWRRRAAEMTDDLQLVSEVVEGWGAEILGPDDQPVPFSAEALAKLIDAYPASGREIATAYIRALTDARLGN